ncbi:MAG: hypothetical protein ACYSWO_18295 [Planctomycetota bacterium]|jgi:hypothetical protein
MAKKINVLLSVPLVAAAACLISLAGASVAEVGSAIADDRSDGVTISLEACVVRVGAEALEQGARGAGFQALSSLSADTLLDGIGSKDVEVVSGVALLVGNGTEAEISAEDSSSEKGKHVENEVGEHAVRETSVSLRAEARVTTAGEILVEFSFKQIFSENASSESDGGMREEEAAQVFEVSSSVVLQTGRPQIVGARRHEGEAMFLILHADI